jgi:hypothetical protein
MSQTTLGHSQNYPGSNALHSSDETRIARAIKTLKNVNGLWIENQEALIDEKGKKAPGQDITKKFSEV